MTSMGGTSTVGTGGTVFKVTLGSTHTIVYSFSVEATDGSMPGPLGNLLQAGDGNFYGTTEMGGASNNGIVFKLTPDGTETIVYTFVGDPTTRDINAGPLIQSRNGNLYGVTLTGGTGNFGAIYELD